MKYIQDDDDDDDDDDEAPFHNFPSFHSRLRYGVHKCVGLIRFYGMEAKNELQDSSSRWHQLTNHFNGNDNNTLYTVLIYENRNLTTDKKIIGYEIIL